jgi:hypothetical protein
MELKLCEKNFVRGKIYSKIYRKILPTSQNPNIDPAKP